MKAIFPPLSFVVTCLVFSLLLLAQLALGASNADLVLKSSEGKQLMRVPLPENRFAIRYTHSVALTPVTDYFIASLPNIILDKTEYQDFGAGLPHTPEGKQKMEAAGGKITISGYEREMRDFDLRVGRIADHTLIIPAGELFREIKLNKLLEPGKAISFSVCPTAQ